MLLGVIALLITVSVTTAHNMFCISSSLLSSPEPNELKCSYHYKYITRDGKTCFIIFTLGNGITLVPQSTLHVSSSAIAQLGNMAIKADIYGIADKKDKKTESTKPTLKNVGASAQQLQQEGLKMFTRFTMSDLGIPLAIRFEPEAMPSVNVKRLFNRDSVAGNMTLEQLQSIIGLGRVADDLADLIAKMKYMKINGCFIKMPFIS